MDEEEKITEEIDAALKRMLNDLNAWEAALFPHDPGPEGEGKTSSQEDGWQKSCDLPRRWTSKEKQPNFKENRGTTQVEKSSPDEAWQESCDQPRGWMNKEKQPNFKEDGGIPCMKKSS